MKCILVKYIQKRRDKSDNKQESTSIGGKAISFKGLMLHWLGIGLKLMSACLVAVVCQASRVFLTRKEPLSLTREWFKSRRWPNNQACLAMFDPQDWLFLCFFLILLFRTVVYIKIVFWHWVPIDSDITNKALFFTLRKTTDQTFQRWYSQPKIAACTKMFKKV